MKTFDFKKEFKNVYHPTQNPAIIDIDKMTYIMVDGKGNPNNGQEYKDAMEILYGIVYGIKMSKKQDVQPEGYFDFVVPPLEGLWSMNSSDFNEIKIIDKTKFTWTSMIRVPDYVTQEVFEEQKEKLFKKKPHLQIDKAYRTVMNEGLCVQIMHVGSFDDEAGSIEKMDNFAKQQGYTIDINDIRRHHEIYLSDYRKVEAAKLKTIIRHPIRK